MKKTVVVALSGGLDSAVTATLLKEDYDVVGLHFLTGFEPPCEEPDLPSPVPGPDSPVHRAAESIGIPLRVIDCSQDFRKEVVQYFINRYRSGKTPNPCVVCNQRIKFGLVLEHAKTLGASALATGHYARVIKTSKGHPFLLKGVDPVKDQSYFLARLTEQQLDKALFPLGTFTKKQVKKMGRDWGYTSFVQKESQELCFVRHPSYRDFLSDLGGFATRPGPIVNTRGDVLGRHEGLHAYTIGQRRGIGIPGPDPYYVLRLDTPKNTLVIGTKEELATAECIVSHVNWISIDPPKTPLYAKTRIRYRHKEVVSVLTPVGPHEVRVSFATPQHAVTPGQAAVFYQGNRVIGGGWISP
jgi:tRNA-specific 2-thiouridylase